MARLLKYDGLLRDVYPDNGRYFEFDEIFEWLGFDEVVRIALPGQLVLVFDAVDGLPGNDFRPNELATQIVLMHSPNTLLGSAWIHGDCLLMTNAEAAAPR